MDIYCKYKRIFSRYNYVLFLVSDGSEVYLAGYGQVEYQKFKEDFSKEELVYMEKNGYKRYISFSSIVLLRWRYPLKESFPLFRLPVRNLMWKMIPKKYADLIFTRAQEFQPIQSSGIIVTNRVNRD